MLVITTHLIDDVYVQPAAQATRNGNFTRRKVEKRIAVTISK